MLSTLYVCVKGCRVDIYVGSHWHSCNLTNICQKASACIGLHVAMVPESYQRLSMQRSWCGLASHCLSWLLK
jgi:hypothetical protein